MDLRPLETASGRPYFYGGGEGDEIVLIAEKARCWEGRVMLETVSRDGEGSPNQPPASRVLPSLQSYLSCPCPEQS